MSKTAPDDDGRETLSETFTDALGDSLVRAMERNSSNPAKVQEAFRNINAMNHAKLYELLGPRSHDSGVDAWLKRPDLVSREHGRLFWDLDLVHQDMETERLGRHLPRATDAPRLFLSYSWGHDDETIFWIEEFAGWLFNRGYDIVFDRDPRHKAKGFTSNDLLWLLAGCSQMIALIDDGYQERIRDPKRTSPLCQEFALAPHFFRQFRQPRLLGLWIKGERLLPPFTPQWVVDYRDEDAYRARRDAAFPIRQYKVVGVAQDGSVREVGPMERRSVRDTVHSMLTEQGAEGVAVRDVTNALKPT